MTRVVSLTLMGLELECQGQGQLNQPHDGKSGFQAQRSALLISPFYSPVLLDLRLFETGDWYQLLPKVPKILSSTSPQVPLTEQIRQSTVCFPSWGSVRRCLILIFCYNRMVTEFKKRELLIRKLMLNLKDSRESFTHMLWRQIRFLAVTWA